MNIIVKKKKKTTLCSLCKELWARLHVQKIIFWGREREGKKGNMLQELLSKDV